MNRRHIATRGPAPSGKARGLCGVWSLDFTGDREEVTCKRCIAIAPQLVRESPAPQQQEASA